MKRVDNRARFPHSIQTRLRCKFSPFFSNRVSIRLLLFRYFAQYGTESGGSRTLFGTLLTDTEEKRKNFVKKIKAV